MKEFSELNIFKPESDEDFKSINQRCQGYRCESDIPIFELK